ncbi:Retrotransposon Copia-like [Theobroma cacao]|nr:Retrotransposon Copia-like [Theobroma cacao]
MLTTLLEVNRGQLVVVASLGIQMDLLLGCQESNFAKFMAILYALHLLASYPYNGYNLIIESDSKSSYFLHHFDNQKSMVISPKLTSVNYSSWSRSFMFALSIRNKSGFLDGSILEPKHSDNLYVLWLRCNNLIIAWLLELVSLLIASTVLYMDKALEIWETLKKRFSQLDDAGICNL